MFDETTFNNRHVAEVGVDPVLAMLAERNRLYELAEDKLKAACEVQKTLPEEVREGKVSIMEGDPLYGGSYTDFR